MATDNHLGVDLWSEFTETEVMERIEEYLGKSEASEVDMGAITNLVRGVFRLKNAREREAFLSALGAFFCRQCGSGYLPCYCTRDD